MLFPNQRKCNKCQFQSSDAAVMLCPKCGAEMPALLTAIQRTIIWICFITFIPVLFMLNSTDSKGGSASSSTTSETVTNVGAVIGLILIATVMWGAVGILIRRRRALTLRNQTGKE